MFIKSYLSKSHINGTGCFTDEPILSMSYIWQFDYNSDSIHKGELMPELDQFPNYRDYVMKYGFYRKDVDTWFLTSDICLAYLNHSKEPNCSYNSRDISIRTLRNIGKGEELTIDYDGLCDHYRLRNYNKF